MEGKEGGWLQEELGQRREREGNAGITINQTRKSEATHSELAVPREAATSTRIRQRLKGQQGSRELLRGEREGSRCALIGGC